MTEIVDRIKPDTNPPYSEAFNYILEYIGPLHREYVHHLALRLDPSSLSEEEVALLNSDDVNLDAFFKTWCQRQNENNPQFAGEDLDGNLVTEFDSKWYESEYRHYAWAASDTLLSIASALEDYSVPKPKELERLMQFAQYLVQYDTKVTKRGYYMVHDVETMRSISEQIDALNTATEFMSPKGLTPLNFGFIRNNGRLRQ